MTFSETITLDWSLLVVGVFLLIHVFGVRLHPWLEKRAARTRSFSGGLAIAYVFLHVFPELEDGAHALGDRIYLVALLGLTLFHGLERLAVSRRNATRAGASEHVAHTVDSALEHNHRGPFALHMGMAWVYGWLLIYALPNDLEEGVGLALIGALSLGLHLLFRDFGLRETYEDQFIQRGRYIIATGPLSAWLLSLFVAPGNELVIDIIFALLAGSVMQTVFRDELPRSEDSRFGWFVAGITLYLALYLVPFAV